MDSIMEYISSWINLLPRITLTNIFEIIIIAVIVYEVLLWINNTRAWILLKGLMMIFAFTVFAAVLRLDTILWILGKIATIAVTALIIIFQPELRKALEQLGRRNFLSMFSVYDSSDSEFTEKTLNELVKASFELAKARTGALMVIERNESLEEIERTGIEIDGLVSSQLLINIFEHNTPLHDGAVVIRGNHITAATCYLPLSDNMRISKDLGTRHRAAIGVSESTDSLTIVVSEETGRVSVADKGMLRRVTDADELREKLSVLLQEEETTKKFRIWKGKTKDEGKVD